MNLTNQIESAEHRFKQILERYFASVYNEKILPSHGINHHRRVWINAKELLQVYYNYRSVIDPLLPFSLIIACYFHDIGMSIDSGVRHGHHGMDLCRKFLNENNLNEGNFPGLLTAIQNHDNKEYNEPWVKNELQTILSVADDLDAFGYTGIYRYLEIYIIRGASAKDIGFAIRDNAKKRFMHFSEAFGFDVTVIERHTKRFKILDNFFIEYEKQLPGYMSGSSRGGYCGVMEILSQCIKEENDMVDFIKKASTKHNDRIIKYFFTELKSELL